jgi:hypothetical protein
MVMWHTRAHDHVQSQLAEADIYIRWALPTFHSTRNQSRFYLTHVHPFNKTPITIRHIHYKNARKDALDYHILITLLCKVPCRVAAMWVQGSSDVTTSWSGLVALPAPDYYNGHPLLTTYKTCYEAYISLNSELNALGYFNLAVIVHSRPGVIGATRYKKTPKLKVAPIRALSRFIYVRPRRVTRM